MWSPEACSFPGVPFSIFWNRLANVQFQWGNSSKSEDEPASPVRNNQKSKEPISTLAHSFCNSHKFLILFFFLWDLFNIPLVAWLSTAWCVSIKFKSLLKALKNGIGLSFFIILGTCMCSTSLFVMCLLIPVLLLSIRFCCWSDTRKEVALELPFFWFVRFWMVMIVLQCKPI